MSTLALGSTSRATDAGWLAAADIARIASGLGAVYRLVGGLAVTLLVHAHDATHLAAARETADADMGVPFDVCGDEQLPGALRAAGYAQVEGNRFVRHDGARELVIDVLAPSYEGRLISNQEHGGLVLDEVPGLQTALLEPATAVTVRATLTDGSVVATSLMLPDITAALVMKAYAYRGRFSAADALDIHRLLEAARVAGRTVDDWPRRSEAREAAHILHDLFGKPRRHRHLQPVAAARVRLLVREVVPAP